MTLTLVRPGHDAGDRITPDGTWSLTHELTDDPDDDATDRVVVVATHLATGLEVTHDLAGADDWLMSGVALADLVAQAADTITGIAVDEDRNAAWTALLRLGELLPRTAVERVEYRCECGGWLAYGPGRALLHVDVCQDEVRRAGCDRDDHRFCLAPAPRQCGHACKARGRVYTAGPCDADHDDCCGQHHGYGD